MKVEASSYQYQMDSVGREWIFRYDYAREPAGGHPCSHLQINGELNIDGILKPDKPLGRVHLPTDRVSIESVIRLLILEFGVPSKGGREYWEPLLRESERAFQAIAHRA